MVYLSFVLFLCRRGEPLIPPRRNFCYHFSHVYIVPGAVFVVCHSMIFLFYYYVLLNHNFFVCFSLDLNEITKNDGFSSLFLLIIKFNCGIELLDLYLFIIETIKHHLLDVENA
jgi:hypothetical protein